MNNLTMIIGIFLFAIVVAIIFAWGLYKQQNQTTDLMKLLFSKGQSKIKKYLKKNEYISTTEIENICGNLTASLAFSRNKAVVKDKKDFAEKLVDYMKKTGQVTVDGNIVRKKEK